MEKDVFERVEEAGQMLAISTRLAQYLPASAAVHNMLLVHARGLVSLLHFYVLRNKPDLTVILVKSKEDQSGVMVFCITSEVPELAKALRQTQLVDWSQPLCLLSVPEHLCPVLEDLLKDLAGDDWSKFTVTTYMYQEQKQQELRCGAGLRLTLLGEAGVRKMHAVWWYNHFLPVEKLQELAQASLSVGVYQDPSQTSQHEVNVTHLLEGPKDEEPVAWATMSLDGAIGLLRTAESHRRRGLATLVVEAAAGNLAAQGLIPFAYVDCDNEVSMKLFSSLPNWHTVPTCSVFGVHCEL